MSDRRGDPEFSCEGEREEAFDCLRDDPERTEDVSLTHKREDDEARGDA